MDLEHHRHKDHEAQHAWSVFPSPGQTLRGGRKEGLTLTARELEGKELYTLL